MHRLLAYSFPFILIAIEYVLRSALKTETAGFVGPTLATAAAGLLIPTLALKSKASTLPDELRREVERIGITVRSSRDERVAAVSLLLLLIFVALWAWTLVLVEQKDSVTIMRLDRTIFIGILCYMAAVIVAEVKEAA